MQTHADADRPHDWDEASEVVSDAYFPHVLTPLSKGSNADHMVVNTVDLGPIRIARIGWGAEVSIETDHPGAYAINIPLGGRLESRTARDSVVSTPGLATVNPPDTPTLITRWSSACTIVGVRIDRDHLHRELGRVMARPDVRLPAQIDLRASAGAGWLRMVRAVHAEADDEGLWRNPIVAQQLSGALTSALVLAAIGEPDGDHQQIRPRIVTRVVDAVHADPSRAWTAADMADAAGVSVRRLQEGFREYVGMSPREYLNDVRLVRVNGELSDPGAVISVTEVAMKWGFTHTGRFAASYRRKYGESPSDTLRRT
ncbi:AraC family transcriptional regulator [Williamsia limnetica]|uniref:AraC family transcriptional regulator n=1 Tax=Williamsia limnetica TaxID=882452 RepID=A0A318S5P6_WILLI|nr:AraC family transcriptional regulator [Williamsia limnetica]PYE19459.1 AraC family transcriptional regulator [Williamsia limnetica]